jgi:hypothetical protein
MKTKEYIKVLLENGIKANTIENLNLSQIEVLAKRFIVSEQWTKQQSTEIKYSTPITNLQGGKPAAIPPPTDPSKKTMVGLEGGKLVVTQAEGEMTEDETMDIVNDPDATADGMPTTEGEMNEKFESKAQQGLFWAKCNNSTGKTKEKWCKMAKEFSDSTSKKQYKDMPEKKHPEKTVKKKTTKENYEKFLENRIVEMLGDYINPAMTKGKLIQSVNERKNSESFMLKQPKKNSMFSQDEGKEMKTMKKPIGRMFSMGGEMSEDTKEKTRTKPDTDTDKKEKRPGKKNPFEPKHKPAPKAKRGEYNEQTIAPTKPGTKERTKEKNPGKKNPFEPKHKPAPKAGNKEIPTWLTWNKLGVNLK